MAKDRARPFSRKHRKYWIPVTGGMIVIGIINVALGYCSYSSAPEKHERIQIGPEVDPAAEMARAAAQRYREKQAAEAAKNGSDAAAEPRGSGSGSSVPR